MEKLKIHRIDINDYGRHDIEVGDYVVLYSTELKSYTKKPNSAGVVLAIKSEGELITPYFLDIFYPYGLWFWTCRRETK